MLPLTRNGPASPIAVELDPGPGSWASLVSHNTSERANRFREQLGLATDRPILMTGHQAQLWHPGILAKFFAARALAERVGGTPAWLIVDMDVNEALTLRVPVRRAGGAMTDLALDLVPKEARNDARPTGLRPAVRPAPIELGPETACATPEIAQRLDRLRASIEQHADAPSLAAQATLAMFGALGLEAPTIVSPSRFAETDLFREVLQIAAEDPGHFAASFNESAAAVPESGVAPVSLGREELPMWRLDERGRRVRAQAGDLRRGEKILPGGLLMTGLVRLAGCDLFIHGTGGRAYEPVNDLWLAQILEGTLAPFTTATATLTLDFGDAAPVSPREAARAAWRAHHARHEPSLVGDEDAQRQKRSLAARIEALPRHSAERRKLYEEILAILDRVRGEHAREIASVRSEAERARQLASEHRLRTDRTWSAALHPGERLSALDEQIRAQLTG